MFIKKRTLVTVSLILIVTLIAGTAFITFGIMNPFGFFEYGIFLQFWFTSHSISTLYHGEVTPEQLSQGAIRGMVESVGDPYTMYFNRDEATSLMAMITGGFYGVGLYISTHDDGYVMVISPIRGTPAYRAGIVSGDRILKVDGEEVDNSTEAANRMRGPAGTQVVVTLQRAYNDEIEEIEITRARVEITTVESRMLDDRILYVSISQFARTTPEEFREQMNTELRAISNTENGIIIDLRNNGGGLLDAAVDIASLFLPDDTLVVYSEGRGSRRREYRTRLRGFNVDANHDTPLIILTNNFSASASEILVGAFRDHERATIVGEQTFGKGTVQTSLPMFGGGALNVTSARYFTPNGYDINDEGIEPDIYVPLPAYMLFLNLSDEDDPQLQAAIQAIHELGER